MKKFTRQGPKTMKTLSAPELAFIRGEGEGGTHRMGLGFRSYYKLCVRECL